MKRMQGLLATLALAIAALGLGAAASATTLELAPVSHDLSAARPTLGMNVTNRSGTAVTLQVRGYAWDQDGGDDRLQPAPEIIVSPPIFRIEPGQTQVLRALVQGAATDRERSYRLLIDELPAIDAEQPAVRMALRVSVPVFVKPVVEQPARLQWTLAADGRSVRVANRGGVRERVHRLELLTPDGRRLPGSAAGPYVLAGAERRWTLPEGSPHPGPGEPMRIQALTDAGRIEVPLAVAP